MKPSKIPLGRRSAGEGAPLRDLRNWPLRRELPYRAVAVVSALLGSAIEVAVRVEYYAADRLCSIASAGKVIQVGECSGAAGLRELEDLALPASRKVCPARTVMSSKAGLRPFQQIPLTNVPDSDRLRHASLESAPVYGGAF